MADEPKSFWQKHPGFDLYSLFLLLIVVLLIFVGRLIRPLWIPALVVLVYLIYRLLSKKADNRTVENARFVALLGSVFRWFRQKKTIQTDKEFYYFKCPTCGQPMRVPRGLGKVQITCRSCSSQFETNS